MKRPRRFGRRLLYNAPVAAVLRSCLDRWRAVPSLLFVATTGRSGSGLLAALLSRAEGVVAYHEARPIMNGRAVADRNAGRDGYAHDLYWYRKSLRIRWAGAGHRVYAETNHLFITAFADWATEDFGSRLRVIHLRRRRRAVARSIYLLGTLPDHGGRHWYLDYRAGRNLLNMASHLQTPAFSHEYYKCLWYWHEIEARVEAYRRQYPQIEVIDADFEDLVCEETAHLMMERLGLVVSKEAVTEVLRKPVNPKSNVKADLGRRLSLDETRRMEARFDEILREFEPSR